MQGGGESVSHLRASSAAALPTVGQFAAPWAASGGLGSGEGVDSLLQTFSPAQGGSLYSSAEDTAAFNEEAVFGGGSGTHSPRHSNMGQAPLGVRHFDAPVGRPPHQSLRSSSAIASLASQVSRAPRPHHHHFKPAVSKAHAWSF